MRHSSTPQTNHPTPSPRASRTDGLQTSVAKRHGRGSCSFVGPLAVLSLEGSFAEMGEQHGALLAEQVARGPIPYFRRMVERLLGKPLGSFAPHAGTLIQRLIGSRIERALPPFALETARGIARGAGLDEDVFLRGCTMPDSLLWLTARLQGLRDPGPAVAHRLALGLGCTSAVAWGDATRDGKLYHARNFDYYGVENWASNAAVIFHAPNEGQRYVSIGAAGVGLGGVTAMNEAGLTLTVHQHMFTDRTALGGVPIGVVGDIVMREAKNLAEAEAILRRHRSIGCWTYVITDGKAKQVLCFEENPERKVAVELDPSSSTFAYANIYLDAELGSTETALYGSYWRHNLGRYERAKELVERGRGTHDAQSMAGILADSGKDARCRVRDSIAMVMTVGSVVFRPEDGIVWVGVGEAPVSRGRFVPFSLAKRGYAPEAGSFSVEGTGSAEDAAFSHFRAAYVAYIDGSDVDGAMAALDEAVAAAPTQSVYAATLGYLAIEANRPARAMAALSRAIEIGHPDVERVSAFHLWRGRAHDLDGRRDQAIADYRTCLGRAADRPVHEAAKRGLKSPFNARAARRVHVEMSLGDVVMP
ncbi:MAG: hypothetical protein HOW73_43065 [Polyangiaceae bacterium]|nr:hypothetical protein [Polyangiaceae bacterium]